jgi:hypothetical protein
MSVEYAQKGTNRRRSSWLPALLLPLLAFLLGLAAMGWLLTRWDAAAQWLGVTPPPPVVQRPINIVPPQPAPQPAPPATREQTGPTQRLVIDPETVRRASTGSSSDFPRSPCSPKLPRGMPAARKACWSPLPARRALDRGVSLGYLEGLLRQRFGGTQPVAVGTVITSARQPVTLEELQVGLQEVGPELLGGGPTRIGGRR